MISIFPTWAYQASLLRISRRLSCSVLRADGIQGRLDQIDSDTTAALERIVQIRERDGVKVKTPPLIVDLGAQYLIQKADAHMHDLPGITGTSVLNGVH